MPTTAQFARFPRRVNARALACRLPADLTVVCCDCLQISLPSVTVTTVAGSVNAPVSVDGPPATARFYNPTALALLGNNLYVAEWGTGYYWSAPGVRVIDLTTLVTSTLVGETTCLPAHTSTIASLTFLETVRPAELVRVSGRSRSAGAVLLFERPGLRQHDQLAVDHRRVPQ